MKSLILGILIVSISAINTQFSINTPLLIINLLGIVAGFTVISLPIFTNKTNGE